MSKQPIAALQRLKQWKTFYFNVDDRWFLTPILGDTETGPAFDAIEAAITRVMSGGTLTENEGQETLELPIVSGRNGQRTGRTASITVSDAVACFRVDEEPESEVVATGRPGDSVDWSIYDLDLL